MSNSFQDLAREIARSQNLRKFNVDTFLNGNALAVFPPTPVTVNPNETPGEMKARIDASQKNTDLGNVFVGGARDAIQGAGETISEIGNFVGLNIPPPRLPEVDKPEGTINNIARGFVQFGTGMLASPVKGFGIGKNIIRGAFSDSYFDPEEGGFVTFLREMGVGPEMLEILDTRVGEDATAIERLQGRLGNAVEGSVLGGIVDTVQYIKQNPHLLQKVRETIVEAGKKIGTDAPKNLENKALKKFAYFANKEGGQTIGNKTIITDIDKELFENKIKPLLASDQSFEDFKKQNLKAEFTSVNDGDYTLSQVDEIDNLLPTNEFFVEVDNFSDQKAIKQRNTFDSDVDNQGDQDGN